MYLPIRTQYRPYCLGYELFMHLCSIFSFRLQRSLVSCVVGWLIRCCAVANVISLAFSLSIFTQYFTESVVCKKMSECYHERMGQGNWWMILFTLFAETAQELCSEYRTRTYESRPMRMLHSVCVLMHVALQGIIIDILPRSGIRSK